ncbi:MAG: hypothetical protein B7Y90_01165 [Alphaproteobacteria bacterium 32-64-14]|nr:MAG: hypothetical protein B7Y90_01165 [Alphaproteobacteria bacterium 32-64-14]
MIRMLATAMAAGLLCSTAIAQPPTPGGQTTPAMIPDEAASLAWMQGTRVHTNADGSQTFEAFLGPVNGVVTGTALTTLGADKAYTEYHRIGPNADGVYGLDVANTRSGMKWSFTPMESIEPGRITFRSKEKGLTVSYASDGEGGIIAEVVRVNNFEMTQQRWHFKPVAQPGTPAL